MLEPATLPVATGGEAPRTGALESPATVSGSRHGHIPALDGLRGLAILLVLLAHLNYARTYLGDLGVDVFFVLSGFLITGLLYSEFRTTGGIGLRAFYWRRGLRLYPALLACLLLTLPFHEMVGLPTVKAWGKAAVVGVTYMADFGAIWGRPEMGNLGHLWTLAIEEHFYLLWPPLLVLALRRGISRPWLLIGMCILTAASVVELFWLARPGPHFNFNAAGRLDTRAFELVGGGILAVAIAGKTLTSVPLRRAGGASGLVAVPLLFLLMVLNPLQLPVEAHIPYFSFIESTAPLVAFLLVLAMLAAVVLSPRGLLSRLLGLAPIRYLGRISYGVYLYHYPLFAIFFTLGDGASLLVQIEAVAASLAVAAASFHFIETPFLRLKSRGWGARRPIEPETNSQPLHMPTPGASTARVEDAV